MQHNDGDDVVGKLCTNIRNIIHRMWITRLKEYMMGSKILVDVGYEIATTHQSEQIYGNCTESEMDDDLGYGECVVNERVGLKGRRCFVFKIYN